MTGLACLLFLEEINDEVLVVLDKVVGKTLCLQIVSEMFSP